MTTPPRTLIGGVGYRWQRDASFGLVAADALARQPWPDGVSVDDLGYGAIFVTEDLAAADPPYERLILLAAAERGRPRGRVYRYVWSQTRPPDAAEVQARIREAGAGVIDLEHLLVIAAHFGALPPEVIVFEAEPVDTSGGERLSAALEGELDRVLADVREEASRAAVGGADCHAAGPGSRKGNRALPELEV